MTFVDSAWITAAGASVLTAAVAIAAIVFWKMNDASALIRGVVYVLVLVLAGVAMLLFFQERKSAITIAGAVGETLDRCRETLDTLNGEITSKLILVDNADAAHQIAQAMKTTIDATKCTRP